MKTGGTLETEITTFIKKVTGSQNNILLISNISKVKSRKLPNNDVCYLIGDTTEHCYCEKENGKNKKGSTNGIICKTKSGYTRRVAYCGSDETCTGPISSDECSIWPLRNKKGDLCTPPSKLDQVLSGLSSFPFGK